MKKAAKKTERPLIAAPEVSHDAFERAFWGNCANTHWEETKHFVYARLMGIPCFGRANFVALQFDAGGKSILDIGGGPISMLLKTVNYFPKAKVVDPTEWPAWVESRYTASGIEYERCAGEKVKETGWDEAWIYNTLQHTEDPQEVVKRARKAAKTIRLFEWVDIPPHTGHPHMLTVDNLRQWLGTRGGDTRQLNESGCVGQAFFGVFPS